MIVPTPVWVFPIALLGALAMTGGVSTITYFHGKFVKQAEFDAGQVKVLEKKIADGQKNTGTANTAGVEHEEHTNEIRTHTNTIYRSVPQPVGAATFLPNWFVCVLDKSAGRTVDGSSSACQHPDGTSDVTLSEAARLLAGPNGWTDLYYQARKQIEDAAALKPVLPSPKEEPKKGVFDQLNPFR